LNVWDCFFPKIVVIDPSPPISELLALLFNIQQKGLGMKKLVFLTLAGLLAACGGGSGGGGNPATNPDILPPVDKLPVDSITGIANVANKEFKSTGMTDGTIDLQKIAFKTNDAGDVTEIVISNKECMNCDEDQNGQRDPEYSDWKPETYKLVQPANNRVAQNVVTPNVFVTNQTFASEAEFMAWFAETDLDMDVFSGGGRLSNGKVWLYIEDEDYDSLAGIGGSVKQASMVGDLYLFGKSQGLSFTDFGYTQYAQPMLDGVPMAGADASGRDIFAFGDETKIIDPSTMSAMSDPMTFTGQAIGRYDVDDEDTHIVKDLSGAATLEFNQGSETLTANFSESGWYDVAVNQGRDITLTHKEGTQIASGFEIDKLHDAFHGGSNWVNNYYGEDGTPTEASGFVQTGEDGRNLEFVYGVKAAE
jgi:hypothetical protein